MKGAFFVTEMIMDWIEKERKRAHTDGVTHPENYPFLLAPDHPNGQAVVLIHGFGATPRSMLAVGEELYRHQFTVIGIRLPGHGTSPQDLMNRKAAEWMQSALCAFDELAACGLNVSVGGLSTGALIALSLASQRPVNRLLLFSPFLRLHHHLAPLAGFLSLIVPYQKRLISASEKNFYYDRRPLKAVAQINHLLRQMPQILPRISVPTLILTSTGDTTIARGTATKLYQRLGARHKIIHTYGDEVPHVITTGENPQLDDVLRRTVDFMSQQFADQ